MQVRVLPMIQKVIKMEPIIKSLLDQDWYKFTMGNYYFENFSNGTAKIEFTDRKNQLPKEQKFVDQINEQFDYVSELKFRKSELDFIFNVRYMRDKTGYREFLRNFQLNRDIIHCELIDDKVAIWTDEDNVMSVSNWEIFILEIVNELYVDWMSTLDDDNFLGSYGIKKAVERKIVEFGKIKMPFIEMGTRRRHSRVFQDALIDKLRHNPKFIGTSNPYLAMKYGLTPSGTMAHEIFMYAQTLKDVPVAQSQKFTWQTWLKTYKGDLGYALHDTLGETKFLKDFDILLAKQYNGPRLDSGDEFKITKDIIQMYKDFGIDSKSKTIVYSNCMDIPKCNGLYDEFNGQIRQVAGIGTNLVCPVYKTNFVAKLVSGNGNRPAAKISCDAVKAQCKDQEFLEYLKWSCERD